MLAPGAIVAGKYRLEQVLGRGGMGMVVEARHVQLGTAFALKFLYKSILKKASLAERFFREARASAALKSEHVCRVFDVGEFEGAPYIVMERLEGNDLAKLLRQETRVPLGEACDYVIQACAGVAEAHAAQIVHRDLKPGNLFVTERADGTPLIKILDFGIAKAPHEADLELTGTDVILGSPSYMSLEQLRSSKLADARSDIWSLGVILFELISGQKPFVGEGLADLALKIALHPVPRLPEGPAELDAVIARCLAHEPAQRYQSAGELARAIAPFADEPARRLAASIGRGLRRTAPVAVIGGRAPVATPSAISTAPSAGMPVPISTSLPTETGDPPAIPLAISTAPSAAAPAVTRSTVPMKKLAAVPVASPNVPPNASPPRDSAVAGNESLLPTTRVPPLDPVESSLGVLVQPAPATTMQTAGVIESRSPARGPGRRVGVIVVTGGILGGILLGVVAGVAGTGDGENAASAAPHLTEPAAAAPGSAASESPQPPPSEPEPQPTVPPPAIAPDAAIGETEEDPAIEMEPAPEQPAKPASRAAGSAAQPDLTRQKPEAAKPTSKAGAAKPTSKAGTEKPTRKDLGKSRI